MKKWLLKNRWFMMQALKEAKKAYEKGEIPVGAVIVKDNKIISKGHNSSITTNDPSAHAEIVAIRKAAKRLKNYRLNGCEVYVTLEPCSMCAGAMVHARIEKLFYATEDPKTGACNSVFNIINSKKLNHKIKVEFGLCKQQAKKIIQNFFQERR